MTNLSKQNKTNMKKLHFLWVLLAPVIFFLSSCKEAPPKESPVVEINLYSVRAEIVALENAYSVASNAKDVEGVAAYYSDDAHSLADDEPTWEGKNAIRAGIKRDFDKDTSGYTVTFNTTGVWAGGDFATETGTSTIKDKDGKVVRTGKYMTLFELRDGKYVAIRDIWNDDAPKKAPMVQ